MKLTERLTMKANKKIIVGLFVIMLIVGMALIMVNRPSKRVPVNEAADNSAEYWTCSMHPQVRQDKPGKRPICGMNLIPVMKGDRGKIVVDDEKREYLDIQSAPAEKRNMVKKLRLPARIGHDSELYTLQQEYLSALSVLSSFKDTFSKELYDRQQALADTAKLRLRLLGLKDE